MSGPAHAQGLAGGLPGSSRTISRNVVQQLTVPKSKTAPSGTVTARVKLSHEEIADRLKYSTCWIIFIKGGKPVLTGTGWVLDVQKRLVITNYHVINHNGPPDAIFCVFPEKDAAGEWISDVKHYLNNVKPSKGTIITSTIQHDLAVVQLDRMPSGVRALKLAQKSAAPGSRLHSLGGKPSGSETMWSYSYGRVRQVGNRRNALGRISRMVECQMATNQGNSGGPIVNDYLEIEAVCEGGYYAKVLDVTIHVDVKQLRSYLVTALPLVNPTTARQFHSRGLAHYTANRYSEAVSDFSAAIRIDSRYAKSYDMRGWAFFRKGDNRTALADFDQAISLDTTNANAHHGRGLVHKAMKKYELAVKDFSNAIRFEPANATHYNERGVVTFATQDVKSSYEDFVQATKLDAANSVYFANRGYAARLIRLYDDSAASYATALRLSGDNYIYFNGLGLACVGQQKYELAQKAFLAAIQHYRKITGKDDWQIFRNLGFALHKSKELKTAYGIYSKAIELSPKTAELYYLRGQVAKDLGRGDLATKDFQTAASLDSKTYGRLASGATGTGNGSTTPVSTVSSGSTTTRATSTSTPVASDRRVIGVWRCVGTYKGTNMRIDAAFVRSGGFAIRFTALVNGRSRSQSTIAGVYLARGGKIYIKAKNGKVESYRYGFLNGQFWIELEQSGVALYFDRRK